MSYLGTIRAGAACQICLALLLSSDHVLRRALAFDTLHVMDVYLYEHMVVCVMISTSMSTS